MIRAFALAAMLLGLAAPAHAEQPGRTFYDRLQLDTPEHAARTFVDAYAAGDYWTVYLILSQKPQDAFVRAVMEFDLGAFLKSDGQIKPEMYKRLFPDPSAWEESQDFGWLFDHLMLIARDTGMMPIQIQPGADIGNPEGTPPQVTVRTSSGPLRIELVRSPAGRWRVQSAIPEGRPRDHLPWGLP